MKKPSNNVKFFAYSFILFYVLGKLLSLIYPASDPASKECPQFLVFLIILMPPFIVSKFSRFEAKSRIGGIAYVVCKFLFVWICSSGIIISIDEASDGDTSLFSAIIWLILPLLAACFSCKKRFSELANRPDGKTQTATSIPKKVRSTPIKSRLPVPKSQKHTMARIDKMDGHDFEQFVADLLRKLGYQGVRVTRGSGDQGVDILAVREGRRYAIQCKRYSSKLGNKPIQEVHTGKTIYNCQVAVVVTNNYFTPGAMEAARVVGVILWDRDRLQGMIAATE